MTPTSPEGCQFIERRFIDEVHEARAALGASWREHRQWVSAYVREEIRLGLVADGWDEDRATEYVKTLRGPK